MNYLQVAAVVLLGAGFVFCWAGAIAPYREDGRIYGAFGGFCLFAAAVFALI